MKDRLLADILAENPKKLVIFRPTTFFSRRPQIIKFFQHFTSNFQLFPRKKFLIICIGCAAYSYRYQLQPIVLIIGTDYAYGRRTALYNMYLPGEIHGGEGSCLVSQLTSKKARKRDFKKLQLIIKILFNI